MPLQILVLAMAAGSVLLAGLLPAELVRDRCGIQFTSLLLAEAGPARVAPVTWPAAGAAEAEPLQLVARSLPRVRRDGALRIPVEALYAMGLLGLWTLSSARMRNPGFGAMRDGLRIGLFVPVIELSVGGSGFWGHGALLLFLSAATLCMAGRIGWFLAAPGTRPRTIELRINRREARG